MNKQEIEKELVRARAAETTIKNNIIELLEQLVEAEKPKLGHGDFGVNKDGFNRITFHTGKNRDDYCSKGIVDDSEITIFGNIFKMMEGWGKPFEDWQSEVTNLGDKRRITIGKLGKDIFMGTSGDSGCYSSKVAYEIWCKLGHAIIELKRKKQVEKGADNITTEK